METTAFGLLATVAGALSVYLGAPQQRWLARPWPSRPARLAGAALLALGGHGLALERTMWAASLVWLSTLMLAWVALPSLGALRPGHERGRR